MANWNTCLPSWHDHCMFVAINAETFLHHKCRRFWPQFIGYLDIIKYQVTFCNLDTCLCFVQPTDSKQYVKVQTFEHNCWNTYCLLSDCNLSTNNFFSPLFCICSQSDSKPHFFVDNKPQTIY